VGVIEEVGDDVRGVRPGDKVVSPFWISCGQCHFYQEELYSSCTTGGLYGFGEQFWPADGPVQGGQSEYVRVPMADGTLELIPENLAADANDLRVLPLSDVFSTGYHAVVGADLRAENTVLVIGDGAVGLLAAHAARLFEPAAIVLAGHHDDRLAIGEVLGATHSAGGPQRRSDDILVTAARRPTTCPAVQLVIGSPLSTGSSKSRHRGQGHCAPPAVTYGQP
jgi:threonine dehydrogenase-like Zn-dependent dehydrogenase